MRNYYFHPFATKLFPLVNSSFFKDFFSLLKMMLLLHPVTLIFTCLFSFKVQRSLFPPFLLWNMYSFLASISRSTNQKKKKNISEGLPFVEWKSKSPTALIGCFCFMSHTSHLMYYLLQKYYYCLQLPFNCVSTAFSVLCIAFLTKSSTFFLSIISKEFFSKLRI